MPALTHFPVQSTRIHTPHDREHIGAALRRFKKLVERSGLKGEIRAHEYYEKPCDARRRKEARRKNAIRKAALGKPVKKERQY